MSELSTTAVVISTSKQSIDCVSTISVITLGPVDREDRIHDDRRQKRVAAGGRVSLAAGQGTVHRALLTVGVTEQVADLVRKNREQIHAVLLALIARRG